jgi:hypothetical protein
LQALADLGGEEFAPLMQRVLSAATAPLQAALQQAQAAREQADRQLSYLLQVQQRSDFDRAISVHAAGMQIGPAERAALQAESDKMIAAFGDLAAFGYSEALPGAMKKVFPQYDPIQADRMAAAERRNYAAAGTLPPPRAQAANAVPEGRAGYLQRMRAAAANYRSGQTPETAAMNAAGT